MNKGLLFTMMTVFMVTSIISLGMTFADVNLEAKSDVGSLTSGTKLGYAFKSVERHLIRAAGLDIEKDGKTITFNDTIPREEDPQNFMDKYGEFIDDKFEDRTMEIDFINSAGNSINWDEVEEITIRPFNITYIYPNTGKNSLEVEYENETKLEHLERIDIDIIIPNEEFTEDTWSPDHECSPAGTPPDCLPFRAKAFFQNGTEAWDSGEKNFALDQQSSIQHDVGSGWFRIRVGSTGGNQRILQIDIQDIEINTSTTLEFDTEDFSVINDPARLRVSDQLTHVEADV